MIPAATALAKTAAAPKPRLGFFYFPHGAVMEKWTPADARARTSTLPPILEPLSRSRTQLTVISGLGNKPGESRAVHALVPAHLAVLRASARDARARMAAHGRPDRRAAHRAGHAAAVARDRHRAGPRRRQRLRSRLRLQLLGHASPSARLDAAADGDNPRKLFLRLFGQGDSPHERAFLDAADASLLDMIAARCRHAVRARWAPPTARTLRRLPRQRARDRTAHAEAAAQGDLAQAASCPRCRRALPRTSTST